MDANVEVRFGCETVSPSVASPEMALVGEKCDIQAVRLWALFAVKKLSAMWMRGGRRGCCLRFGGRVLRSNFRFLGVGMRCLARYW